MAECLMKSRRAFILVVAFTAGLCLSFFLFHRPEFQPNVKTPSWRDLRVLSEFPRGLHHEDDEEVDRVPFSDPTVPLDDAKFALRVALPTASSLALQQKRRRQEQLLLLLRRYRQTIQRRQLQQHQQQQRQQQQFLQSPQYQRQQEQQQRQQPQQQQHQPQQQQRSYTFDDVLKPEAHDYLAPVNLFKSSVAAVVTTGNASRGAAHAQPSQDVLLGLMGDVFRTGYGLKPYVTRDGRRRGWEENGVVFLPTAKGARPRKGGNEIPFDKPNDVEYHVPMDEKRFYPGGKPPSDPAAREPKIITWYGRIGYVWPMSELKRLRKCPDFPCRITSSWRFAQNSSALIVDGRAMRGTAPKRSHPDQVFVFHMVETPSAPDERHHPRHHPSWKTIFNWTMAYRSDSDIPVYYGLIRKRPNPDLNSSSSSSSTDEEAGGIGEGKDFKAIVARKTKMAASITGHCGTRSMRGEYTRALSRHISVDVFGACGRRHEYPRGRDRALGEMIGETYKFYLSFENALCDGYVTEKFFRYMALDVLVVARGGPGYLEHVPPELFIDASRFESPRRLAEHLIHLDRNPDVYEAMLRRKSHYASLYEEWLHVGGEPGLAVSYVHYHYEAVPVCRLCHWLWNLEAHRKSVPDVVEWYDSRASCHNPTSVPVD